MVDPIMPDAYTGMSVGSRAATFCIIAVMPLRSSVAMPAGAAYSSIRPPPAAMRYALKLLLPQLIPMISSCLASRDTRTSVDRIHRARDPGRAPGCQEKCKLRHFLRGTDPREGMTDNVYCTCPLRVAAARIGSAQGRRVDAGGRNRVDSYVVRRKFECGGLHHIVERRLGCGIRCEPRRREFGIDG